MNKVEKLNSIETLVNKLVAKEHENNIVMSREPSRNYYKLSLNIKFIYQAELDKLLNEIDKLDLSYLIDDNKLILY